MSEAAKEMFRKYGDTYKERIKELESQLAAALELCRAAKVLGVACKKSFDFPPKLEDAILNSSNHANASIALGFAVKAYESTYGPIEPK